MRLSPPIERGKAVEIGGAVEFDADEHGVASEHGPAEPCGGGETVTTTTASSESPAATLYRVTTRQFDEISDSLDQLEEGRPYPCWHTARMKADDEDLDWSTEAFAELRGNLDYARDLIRGGQHLERLQVGAFDVTDLYRSAWVQAVSSLDHWVHREVYDRALGFALNPHVPRPKRFLRMDVPMDLLENVLHHSAEPRELFPDYLRAKFGHLSFQAPDKIKEALGHVTDEQVWPSVASLLGADPTADLKAIVQRRHRIAHEADRDPDRPGHKKPVSGGEAAAVVERVAQIAAALAQVLGPPPLVPPAAPAAGPKVVPAELYVSFWSEFSGLARTHGWKDGTAPVRANWYAMPTGVSGATWSVSFSRFGCRSELYFEDADPAVNLARWQVLADREAEIVEHYGGEVFFDELPKNKGCRVETRLFGPKVAEREKWPDVIAWMEDAQLRLRAAVDAVGGVPSVRPVG